MNVFCDGSISRNPKGQMKYAFVIPDLSYQESGVVEDTAFNTNWVAECTAVNKALEWCLKQGLEINSIIVHSDLQNLTRSLNRDKPRLRKREKTFYPILKNIFILKTYFKDLKFRWIPREMNQKADALTRI